jgi:PAS domain S-box-containing protein
MFQSNPQPMWVYDLTTFRFLEVNDAAVARYGYSRDEFLALHLEDIRPAEDHEALRAVLAQPLPELTVPSRWRHRWKSGEIREVEISSHDIDWNGTPARLVLPVDVTARERAQRELQEQATLLEKAHDGILLRGPDGTIRQWNGGAERIFGYTRDEAVGKSEQELLRFTQNDNLAIATQTAMRTGGWSGELEATARDGSVVLLDASWTALDGPHHAPASILAIYTDVTERRQIQAQFLRAQRLESIGTLAGGIAHDLNNMLAPISLSIELLRGDMPREDVLHMLDTIEQSARRGADLVRQVLSFARGVDGARESVHIVHMLSDIARLTHDTFPRSIDIRSKVRGPLPDVHGDSTQLHQVLLNLCVNARDAMPEGGVLTLAAEQVVLDQRRASFVVNGRPGVFLRISVTDTGTGIPSELQARIFEPFFTTKDLSLGTGLGLSTVLAIVRSHDGFMNVDSAPGHSSTFNVYLPAAGNTAAAEAPPATAAMPRGQNELVLIVDDEAAVRSITQRMLESFGYRTLTATDGASALALYLARRTDIALVLTDVMMPHMDGASLSRALREINPAVRIITSSGFDATGATRSSTKADARAFLQKPYNAETLLRVVRETLDRPHATYAIS